MAIYACGVLAGISSAYLILTTTFGRNASLADVGVRMWGFTGPLGAFICAWGGLAMLVSAPFDNWWHNAYGLDVRIISPPHMVLAAGFFGIELGAVMLLLAFMNRAADTQRAALQRLFLYVSGTAICESLLLKLEFINRSEMHTAAFYIAVMIGTPAILVANAVASQRRWACTIMTSVYTAFAAGFLCAWPGPPWAIVTVMETLAEDLLLLAADHARDAAMRAAMNASVQAATDAAVAASIDAATQAAISASADAAAHHGGAAGGHH